MFKDPKVKYKGESSSSNLSRSSAYFLWFRTVRAIKPAHNNVYRIAKWYLSSLKWLPVLKIYNWTFIGIFLILRWWEFANVPML